MANQAKVAAIYAELQLQTAKFKAALDEATGEMRRFSQNTRAQMQEANGSVALLGEQIGIHLPRHLRTFVTQLPGVASAMSAAFSAVAVIALANVVVEAGEKVYEFAKKNEEAARKIGNANRELTGELVKSNAQLAIANDRLENNIAKLSKKPQNALKLALDEAKLSAIDLADQLEKATAKEHALLESQNASWYSRALGTVGTESAQRGLDAYQEQYRSINARYDQQLGRAKSLAEEEENEKKRKQDLLALSQRYYNSLSSEIQARSDYQKRYSANDLNTDEARQFEGRYGFGDQSKILPALQNLQGRIGLEATSMQLSVHHDELEKSSQSLTARKDLEDQAKKADAERLRQYEEQLAKKKALHGVDAMEESAFWVERLSKFKESSEQYLAVLERYNSAHRTMISEEHSALARTKTDPGWGHAQHGDDSSLIEANARLALSRAAMNAELGESALKYGVATGAISAHDAAVQQANIHAELYRQKLSALVAEVSRLHEQSDSFSGMVDNPDQQAKLKGLEEQINDLSGKFKIQQFQDQMAALSTSWKGMIDNVFDTVIARSQQTTSHFGNASMQLVDGVNGEFAKGLSGGKMNFAGVMQGASQSFAKAGLEKAEGAVLKGLGFGKRDGSSPGQALWVQMSSGSDMPSKDTMSSMFGDSKQKVVGPNGESALGGSLMSQGAGGLIGMLNDSDWASGLFGGKLFGSGSFFGGHFASGGDVPGGVAIDVGELGPERFVTPGPGKIIPNSQYSSGSTRLYIDARGTDPALTRANVERGMRQTHMRAVADAQRISAERSRRVPQ